MIKRGRKFVTSIGVAEDATKEVLATGLMIEQVETGHLFLRVAAMSVDPCYIVLKIVPKPRTMIL